MASRARWYTPCDFAQNSLTGFLANLLVGEYPQSPFEHYLAVVATPPAEAYKTLVSSSLFLCFFFLIQEDIIA